MQLQTFNIPVTLPVFSLLEIAVWLGFSFLSILLSFVYFHKEKQYQDKIGLSNNVEMKLGIKAYCLMLLGGFFFFIFSIYVLIMQSNRHSKNPPEAVIARFENDI